MFPTRCRAGQRSHTHPKHRWNQKQDKIHIYSCTWTIRTWIVFSCRAPPSSRIHGIVFDSAIIKPKNKVDKTETNYRTATSFVFFLSLLVCLTHTHTYTPDIYRLFHSKVDLHPDFLSFFFGKITYTQSPLPSSYRINNDTVLILHHQLVHQQPSFLSCFHLPTVWSVHYPSFY